MKSMKKILSSVLLAAMLVSAAIVPTGAKTGQTNVEVEALYMSQMPTFDGIINDAEWGAEPTFTVKASTAAKIGDTSPSDDNTLGWYAYNKDKDGNYIAIDPYGKVDESGVYPASDTHKNNLQGYEYKVWLRWDTEYCYIAIKATDPDGYYLADGRDNIWDGDSVQFRLDPSGPNSYQAYKNPGYDYKTTAFDPEISPEAENLRYYPWLFTENICNIGLGQVTRKNGYTQDQAYDMSNTGNMAATQLVNDNKLAELDSQGLPNERTGGVNMKSELAIKITNGDGNATENVYEYAIPWAYADQWNLGQVGVGYAWGMTIAFLQGSAQTGHYNSFLTWGSGVCGAQQTDMELLPTAGGSNAVVLSDKDITGVVVPDLPVAKKNNVGTDTTEKILIADKNACEVSTASPDYALDSDGFYTDVDVCYLGDMDEGVTEVGFVCGMNNATFAGWDKETKKFIIGSTAGENGVNKDLPYTVSAETFDWVAGEWHNIAVRTVRDTVTIYCDGKEYASNQSDTNLFLDSASGKPAVVLYNLGKFAFDNWQFASPDYKNGTAETIYFNYTFNGDDTKWNTSDSNIMSMQNYFKAVEAKCTGADENSEYGHNYKCVGGKTVCAYCKDELSTVVYGDLDGNGSVTVSDAVVLLKYCAKWAGITVDEVVADVNKDGNVSLNDVTLILKKVAGWNVQLGY